MGVSLRIIVLWKCSGPNYGVGKSKAILGARGQRMVVARGRVTYRRPEFLDRSGWGNRQHMKLAKPRIDIGFATNHAPAAARNISGDAIISQPEE